MLLLSLLIPTTGAYLSTSGDMSMLQNKDDMKENNILYLVVLFIDINNVFLFQKSIFGSNSSDGLDPDFGLSCFSPPFWSMGDHHWGAPHGCWQVCCGK